MYAPPTDPAEALKGPALVPDCPPPDAPLIIHDAELARRLRLMAERMSMSPSDLVDFCLNQALGDC